jgi:serine/threonine protein phosphatase PrpC
MLIRPGIELANLSDVGLHRAGNEDYYGYAEPGDDEQFLRKGRLVLIADGMGGQAGGEVASTLAVEQVRDVYLSHPSADPSEALMAGFAAAHAAIQQYAQQHPELYGMGTTCTAAVLNAGELFYGHVGDSRLYLLRDDAISQLSEDHSQVARLLKEGVIDPEQAAVHPGRHVLTAALGMEAAVPGDYSQSPIPLQSGDMLLMCTDGLHGLVADEEMLRVARSKTPREACVELVNLAKDRGGFDNITLQLVLVN